jgi:ParB-like chromosome segregation protein Spo0J
MAKKTDKGSGVDSAMIEHIPTAELIPYARNSRTHSELQVQQIAGSIQEFGFCNPVLIDAENGIIAGHGRVMAAHLLKLATVPCLRLTHLTDAQKRAYVIADNRLALNSAWDTELLANELSDLHADDFDMALLGFDAEELEALLGFEAGEIEPPELASGDREPFQQMTFTLHDDQVKMINAATDKAKQAGPFDGPNENSNGNALARIAEAYCG